MFIYGRTSRGEKKRGIRLRAKKWLCSINEVKSSPFPEAGRRKDGGKGEF